MKNGAVTWKAIWQFLRRLIIELPYDPAIPLLVIHQTKVKTCGRKNLYTTVHSSTIHIARHGKQKYLSTDE